ncbi:hypothetical protein AB0L05_14485 [Nonomuraea pusilla]|uniref:hypothetical protein n=1 Tax=Nonomuraea pusilla TaxID=46177 RepID=UPI003332B096
MTRSERSSSVPRQHGEAGSYRAIAAADETQAAHLIAEHIDMTLRQFQQEIRHRLLPTDDSPS